MPKLKIYMLNTLQDGVNLANLLSKDIEIAGMISLTDRDPGDAISGFVSCKKACSTLDIEFIGVESYDLSAPADKDILTGLDIDILIISGWQRLVPDWLLDHVSMHSIGLHGSPWGITRGRGRSPQNWALLLGEKSFSLSLFKVSPGIDDGPVFLTRQFPYDLTDDIRTSHRKVVFLAAEMLEEHVTRVLDGNVEAVPQDGDASYLPQRRPEDGMIDWTCSSRSIYNLIRALTKPYPGASSEIDGVPVKMWKSQLFSLNSDSPATPGEIVAMYENGELLVGTGDGFLLIEEYDIEEYGTTLSPGNAFTSADVSKQMEIIVTRHHEKYPDNAIADEVHAYPGRCKTDD